MRRAEWDVEDHIGEPKPHIDGDLHRDIEPGAALWIAAALIVCVVLFGAYVAPRLAAWLVERGVG